MNRLAHRSTIAALALLAAACGGSSDDTPGGPGGRTTTSGGEGGGTTTAGGEGAGTSTSGGEGGGTTEPESKSPALEIVEWNQDTSALRVLLILKNQDTLPLPVTPTSFSVETTEGFSLGAEPFRWIEEPCPSVNLSSSASLRCELGFSKGADQEPARLLFAALDGREADAPFEVPPPLTRDNFCSRVDFGKRPCVDCAFGCDLFGSTCFEEEDFEAVNEILISSGDYCPEGAPLLSETCYDGLVACLRDECAMDCEFRP